MDITQQSTHLGRDRAKDSPLESLLVYWGEDRIKTLAGLGVGSQSPIVGAIIPLTSSSIPQPKQTRSAKSRVPAYFSHPFTSRINQAIHDLALEYQRLLINKYQNMWEPEDFMMAYGWERKTYVNRMSDARRAIKNHPEIKIILKRH